MEPLTMGLIGSAIANTGMSIYNTIMGHKQNSTNNSYSSRNARLQEDVAYNGLGIRVADAERNGISKWAVVGDSATAGQISNNTEPAQADKLDAVMDLLQAKQMEIATDKLKAEKDNLDYQREYAKEHALPIGIQPGLEQSLLGWLDTPENRKLIENTVGSVLGKGKDVIEKIENFNPSDVSADAKAQVDKAVKDVKKQIPGTKEWTRDRYENKERNGGEKGAVKQSHKDKSGNKARKRKLEAQRRNAGALPGGSIPPDLFMHKNWRR